MSKALKQDCLFSLLNIANDRMNGLSSQQRNKLKGVASFLQEHEAIVFKDAGDVKPPKNTPVLAQTSDGMQAVLELSKRGLWLYSHDGKPVKKPVLRWAHLPYAINYHTLPINREAKI